MSAPTVPCCDPCNYVPPQNIPGAPGIDGAAGAAGADGVNAFTQTTADFSVPLVGANVTVSLINSDWMTVGQVVVVAGPANFTVASKPTSTSAILTFLGYPNDVAPATNIATGASVSPAGLIGPNQTLLPAVASYGLAGSQALTNSFAALLSNAVTLADGTYLLLATVRLDFIGATFAASKTITLKLRETSLGADVADAIVNLESGTPTTATQTFAVVALPPVTFAATAGNIVKVFGQVAAVPGAGDLKVIEVSIIAIKLF